MSNIERMNLRIGGMTCKHCVLAVQEVLDKIEGVEAHNVHIGKAIVEYDRTKANLNSILVGIAEAGYDVGME